LGPLALQQLRRVAAATRLPVIACGGIMSTTDAAQRLTAGASLVQLYTGLVYRGPGLVRDITNVTR
jgi:dihydroorotate dehydrogenase